jgi:hypothetical protein
MSSRLASGALAALNTGMAAVGTSCGAGRA